MHPSSGPDDRRRGAGGGGGPAKAARAGAPPRPPRPARAPRGPAGERAAGPDRGRTGTSTAPRKAAPRRPRPKPIPAVPVRRMLSLTIASFSVLLAFGLVIGSQATQVGFTFVILGVQILFVLAWTVASRPPSPWVTGVVGLLAAVGSAVAVDVPSVAHLGYLGYVVVGSFIAAVVGLLALRGGRAGVTESLGATMVVAVGVVALSAYAVLDRKPLGPQILLAGLAAVGVGLATARVCDVVASMPRISPQVPRGSTGVIAGAMAGTAAGAIAGLMLQGMSPFEGAMAGMAAVLIAVVVDLGTGYAEAGRTLEGDAPFMWLARHMQGPLGAFAFAAPACYIMGVFLR